MEIAGTLWLVAKILLIVFGAVLALAASASLLISGRDLTRDEEKSNEALVGELLLSILGPLGLSLIPGGFFVLSLVVSGYVLLYFLVWSKRNEDLARVARNWRKETVTRRLFLTGVSLLAAGVLGVAFL